VHSSGIPRALAWLVLEYVEPRAWSPLIRRMRVGKRIGAGSAQFPDGRYVFVAGGFTEKSRHVALASAEYYDLVRDKWKWLRPSMNLPRAQPAAAMSPGGERLYVIGGYHRKTDLGMTKGGTRSVVTDTAEHYDFQCKKWTVLAARMTAPRWGAAAAFTPDGKRIYVVGGGDPKRVDVLAALSSAEYFDVEANRWVALPPMNYGRLQPGVAMSPEGKRLYVVGGRRSASVNTAEYLDLTTHTWHNLPRTPHGSPSRVAPSVAITPDGRRLYVVGGKTLLLDPYMNREVGQLLRSVEYFDLVTLEWVRLKAQMQSARCGAPLAMYPDGYGGSGVRLFAFQGRQAPASKGRHTIEHIRVAGDE